MKQETMFEMDQTYLNFMQHVIERQEAGVELDQAVADTLEALQLDHKDKFDATAAVNAGANQKIAFIDEQLRYLRAEKQRQNKIAHRTSRAMVDSLHARGLTELQTQNHLFRLRKTKGKVIANVKELPESFTKQVTTTTTKADTEKLREALILGKEVPGARLEKDTIHF